jgi:hypothetical protein
MRLKWSRTDFKRTPFLKEYDRGFNFRQILRNSVLWHHRSLFFMYYKKSAIWKICIHLSTWIGKIHKKLYSIVQKSCSLLFSLVSQKRGGLNLPLSIDTVLHYYSELQFTKLFKIGIAIFYYFKGTQAWDNFEFFFDLNQVLICPS